MNKVLEISLGAMSPKLSEQLANQGATVSNVEMYERCFDAVTQLYLCGYIAPSVAESTRKKILKEVFKKVEQI